MSPEAHERRVACIRMDAYGAGSDPVSAVNAALADWDGQGMLAA